MSKYLLFMILPIMLCYSHTYQIYVGSTGLLFPYSLGALAYIKSTINPYKYHLHGVSGGSWCSLMYHLEDNLNDHDKLWNRYIGNESTVIKLYDMKSMETVHKSITKNVMEEYNKKYIKKEVNIQQIPISMYVTKIKNNKPFNIAINTYNNIEEIAYYAMCSSYIPLICGKGLWTIYKKKKYIDGVFFHKKPQIDFDAHIDAGKIFCSNKNAGIDQRIFLDIHRSKKMFEFGWEFAKYNLHLLT